MRLYYDRSTNFRHSNGLIFYFSKFNDAKILKYMCKNINFIFLTGIKFMKKSYFKNVCI